MVGTRPKPPLIIIVAVTTLDRPSSAPTERSMPAVMMTKVMPMAMMPVSDTARTMLAMLSGARNRICAVPARREDDAADHHHDQADQALEAHEQRQRIAPLGRRRGRAGLGGRACFGVSHLRLPRICRGQHRVLVDGALELGDVAALAQHHDAVAQADQLRHLAGGDQDAEALAGELAQPRIDLALGADVDAARRLVEQQQARIAEDLLGQHDLLLVAAGQRADRDVGVARPDVELAEGLQHRRRLARGGHQAAGRDALAGPT